MTITDECGAVDDDDVPAAGEGSIGAATVTTNASAPSIPLRRVVAVAASNHETATGVGRPRSCTVRSTPGSSCVIGVAVPDRTETDLAAGTIARPGCGGPLRPWGHARARRVRDLTTIVALR